ncbi:MAG: inositol monophosphatase family protein [Anaerolineae bacterium]|nr:inositol monophosphatase family protein [Anaerolineae bacterium]
MTESLRNYLDFATETAYLAGRLTLGYFQTGVRPDLKDDNSPVTVADRQAEELIRSRIEKRYPHHAIVGEEYGVKESEGASHRWFVDPIDGTKSFIRGVPLYGVLIGLEIEGTVEVGVAYFPALEEMLAAASGEGCWWNGRRARVSEVATLEQSVVAHTNPASFSKYGRAEEWERFKQVAYSCRGWGDAYGHLLVATGRVELMLDPIMNAWDCGPFPPILKEAGGYFGDWQGVPTIHGNEAISTTQLLLDDVLALIRKP